MSYVFRILKTFWVVFWWALDSMLLWLPIAVAGLLDRTGRLSFRFCQVWMWVAKTVSFVRLEVKHIGEVDPSRSYVIISNHQSLYDIPALMLGLGLPLRWVIKKSFMYVPLFGWALWAAKHVFIERENPKKSIKQMDRAIKRLPLGVSVAVFAEGTRSDDGVVREFRSGAFLMALRNEMPILPVTVNGSWKIMPDKHSLSFNPGPVQLIVGEPIETSEYTRKTMRELISRTRDAVIANLDSEYPKSK